MAPHQDSNLLSALSAVENVDVVLNLAGTRGRTAHAQAVDLLGSLGLEDRLAFRLVKPSDGEKQRVAIARAMANQPALILADEPTANLDSARGTDTMRLLRRSRSKTGTRS